ncbi:MAG: hypothetical protein FWG64_03770 [Firmicutes bacterium]|nr:hypothetical protein [Bacillota bacterium]
MFVLNEDFGVFADTQALWITENIYMRILLWICHISALIIFQTAMISLFGQRLVDRFRLQLGFHREVYIIKGGDKNAVILGENIATQDNPKSSADPKRLIVFLLEEEDDAEKFRKKINHFGGIARVLDRNHDIKYQLNMARLGNNWLLPAKKYKIILMSQNASVADEAHHIANLASDKNVPSENLDIFAFVSSEWEREKIENLTQKKNEEKPKYQYTFHIVNEVDLLIRRMIENHPPFACPGLNFSNGKAARSFCVLIIGFGTVGQSALLRLIMNGQFVGGKMCAIVVDKNINDLKDCFLHRYPSLQISCDIDFRDYDVQCDKFFGLLNATENIDYVVTALNSDELNKRTAQDVQLHYERNGKILPFIAISEKNGFQHENEENPFVFGCREEIYKHSVIIREENDRMAKAMNKFYKEKYGGVDWHELSWFKQESNRASTDFISAMLYLVDPKLNAEEAAKMQAIAEGDLEETLSETEHIRWNAFHVAMGYRLMNIDEMRQRFEKTKNPKKASQDEQAKLHVCLVSWYELDAVSEAYKKLQSLANEEPTHDYKNNDRDIIKYIPEILQKMEEK